MWVGYVFSFLLYESILIANWSFSKIKKKKKAVLWIQNPGLKPKKSIDQFKVHNRKADFLHYPRLFFHTKSKPWSSELHAPQKYEPL